MAYYNKEVYLVVIVFIVCNINFQSSSCSTTPHKFNHLKLVIQWPKSFCTVKNCLRIPLPSNFTIHGLWPDNKNSQLNNCKTGDGWQQIQDTNLIGMLDESWPDLTKGKNNISQKIWQYQWKKHGRCGSSVYTLTGYFKKALELKNRFDILKILQQNSMNPGDHVQPSVVKNVIMQATGGVPILQCNSTLGILSEIFICFNPSGASVVHCPVLHRKPSCSLNTVLFPKIDPSHVTPS